MVRVSDSPDGKVDRLILRMSLDSSCGLVEATHTSWRYDAPYLSKTFVKKSSGRTAFYHNREILSLEQIYRDCPTEIPYDYAVAQQQRTDRVRVAVIGTGVDYNHPRLAYKILRLPGRSNQPPKASGLRATLQHWLSLRRSGFWRSSAGVKELLDGEVRALEEALARATPIDANASSGSIVGWDFDDDDSMPYDYEPGNLFHQFEQKTHDTGVAGILTQGTDDIAILPIRARHKANSDGQARALAFAHKFAARIVVITAGDGGEYSGQARTLCTEMAKYPDTLFVLAAGNESHNLDNVSVYPVDCKLENMIVVGAVFDDGRPAAYLVSGTTDKYYTPHNFGPTVVDFGMPADDLPTYDTEGREYRASGTSFTAPQAARLAAFLRKEHPDWTPVQVRKHLCDTVRKPVSPMPDPKRFFRCAGYHKL